MDVNRFYFLKHVFINKALKIPIPVLSVQLHFNNRSEPIVQKLAGVITGYYYEALHLKLNTHNTRTFFSEVDVDVVGGQSQGGQGGVSGVGERPHLHSEGAATQGARQAGADQPQTQATWRNTLLLFSISMYG